MNRTASRPKIPAVVEAQLMAANRHTCCVCHAPRRHVQVHHIDGDARNNRPRNLAVVCLDCHSRVSGDEGLGRRYTEEEVRLYKERWEAECDQVGDASEDPVDEFVREVLVRAEGHQAIPLSLDAGQLLIATIESESPVNVLLASRRQYERWDEDEEITPDVLHEDVFESEIRFPANRAGAYVLWIESADEDEDVAVRVEVALWPAVDDEQD